MDAEDRAMENRLTLVEAWTTNHDTQCTARWNLLIKLMLWGGGTGLMTVLTVLGWTLATLFTLHNDLDVQNDMTKQLLNRPVRAVLQPYDAGSGRP